MNGRKDESMDGKKNEWLKERWKYGWIEGKMDGRIMDGSLEEECKVKWSIDWLAEYNCKTKRKYLENKPSPNSEPHIPWVKQEEAESSFSAGWKNTLARIPKKAERTVVCL